MSQTRLVFKDDEVTAGQPIGEVGNIGKGCAAAAGMGSHLHVEVANVDTGRTYGLSSSGGVLPLEEIKSKTIDPATVPLFNMEWISNPNGVTNISDGNISISGTGFGDSIGRVDVYIPLLTSNPIASGRTISLNLASVQTWTNTKINLHNIFNNIEGFNGYERDFNFPFLLSIYRNDGVFVRNFNFPFFDISSDSGLSCYVIKLWKSGGIQGKGGNKFDPHGKVTRAEFLKMALNAKFGADKYKNPPNFSLYSDVSNQWYASYVNDAKQSGYLNALFDSCFASGVFAGAGESKCFSPNKPITRFEATSILTGIFGLSTNMTKVQSFGRQFIDAPYIYPYSTYIYPAATTKGNAGCYGDEFIVKGYVDGRFGVNDHLRRDQAAKLITLAKGQ